MGSRAIKNRPGTKNKRRYVVVLYILAILLGLTAAGGFAAYAAAESWIATVPDYTDASAYNLAQKTRVYANDGTTLLAEFYLEDREPLSSLDQISPYVTGGTVATEDKRFYEHEGIDPQGIIRAAVVNITGTSEEGASTITQQFVRNTILSAEMEEQTYKRKVREMYIALKLEEQYSKDEILLMYLNTINYGSGAYGIQAAAQKYYGTDAANLTIAQAATLIGIPQSPSNNNPIDNPENCLERRNLVLNRMLTYGTINQAEYEAAIAEPLNLNVQVQATNDGIYAYPYFTSYVRQSLLENYSEAEVFKGGLTVKTTLDIPAQEAAEEAARNKEDAVDDDLEVAMVAVDPSTGFIKALVGGKDYYADEYNLATQATRQPGSSFKTFTLTSAIENGINPTTTTLNCSATTKIGDWQVENYGKSSYGTRTISSAFAVSSNTGFAHLVTLLGPSKVSEIAQRMGIETPLENVPSITLGSQGVTVREMAGAYATIASGGIQRDAVAIESIVDANGKTIYQANTEGTRALTEEVANATEKVMEGVVTSGTGTAAALSNGQSVAGKTGTSEEWRDSWFCGITPQYSVAIWLGCRTERTMSASYTATSVFSDFMDTMIGDQSPQKFPMSGASAPPYRTLTNQELGTLGGYNTVNSSSSSSSNYSNYSSSNSSSDDEEESADTKQDDGSGYYNEEAKNNGSTSSSGSTSTGSSASGDAAGTGSATDTGGGSTGTGSSSGSGSGSTTGGGSTESGSATGGGSTGSGSSGSGSSS